MKKVYMITGFFIAVCMFIFFLLSIEAEKGNKNSDKMPENHTQAVVDEMEAPHETSEVAVSTSFGQVADSTEIPVAESPTRNDGGSGEQERSDEPSFEIHPMRIKDKWGYVDGEGNVVIEPIYDDAKEFQEGLAAVSIDGFWGFIDIEGIIISEPKYRATSSYKNGYAAVSVNHLWGIIDKSGNLLWTPRFDYIEINDDGTANAFGSMSQFLIDMAGHVQVWDNDLYSRGTKIVNDRPISEQAQVFFEEFQGKLNERDIDYLLAHTDESIRCGYDCYGKAEFLKRWVENDKIWDDLNKVITIGPRRYGESEAFIQVPYLSDLIPGTYDYVGYSYVFKEGVSIHLEPNILSDEIDTYGHEMIELLAGSTYLDEEGEEWTSVVTDKGIFGFIKTSNLYNAANFRAIFTFDSMNQRWMLNDILVGD